MYEYRLLFGRKQIEANMYEGRNGPSYRRDRFTLDLSAVKRIRLSTTLYLEVRRIKFR